LVQLVLSLKGTEVLTGLTDAAENLSELEFEVEITEEDDEDEDEDEDEDGEGQGESSGPQPVYRTMPLHAKAHTC
jgi:hypothetical protein